jgi:hypothetical protein
MSVTECPPWRVPENLANLVASDGDSTWEMPGWSPFQVVAMTGTVYKKRAIPLAWQLEFDPFDDAFAAANKELFEADDDHDGYAWADLLAAAVARSAPALSEVLNITDSETSTCVIWTESEDACRLLCETAWSLIFNNSPT